MFVCLFIVLSLKGSNWNAEAAAAETAEGEGGATADGGDYPKDDTPAPPRPEPEPEEVRVVSMSMSVSVSYHACLRSRDAAVSFHITRVIALSFLVYSSSVLYYICHEVVL